ncbi:hypothetical protein TrLO_g1932 [Triparma laevis f. longispina]|uniref:Serine aminopeptidase S33 domain-containing protein n=1 Tax=Triparma laevis f. longispina TaxID=1714387 RepID=A0A9W7AN02_9STRA|nr:hypothetical protein TrLO_g1932 [Triparma laevis f. longispina]
MPGTLFSAQSKFLSTGKYFNLQSSLDADGSSVRLSCCRFEASPEDKRVGKTIEVVFLTGWNESYIKYWELFRDLTSAGFNVTTMDHRSQGLSGRVVEPSAMSFIIDFDSYVVDAEKLVHHVKSRFSPSGPIALVAHSMGGLVSMKLSAFFPNAFLCVVCSAPMIQFKTAPFPWGFAGAMSHLFCALGWGRSFAIGFPKKGWEPENMALPVGTTHDEERCKCWMMMQREHPKIVLAGPSNQWIRASWRGCNSFMKYFFGKSNFPIPVLLFRAGKDRFVHESSQDTFLKNNGSKTRVVSFPNAFHELFLEKDDVRGVAVEEIKKFIVGVGQGERGMLGETVVVGEKEEEEEEGVEETKRSGGAGLAGVTVTLSALVLGVLVARVVARREK